MPIFFFIEKLGYDIDKCEISEHHSLCHLPNRVCACGRGLRPPSTNKFVEGFCPFNTKPTNWYHPQFLDSVTPFEQARFSDAPLLDVDSTRGRALDQSGKQYKQTT